MSDRDGSRSPMGRKSMALMERDHSPHMRLMKRDESPRNHKAKSYSRSRSRDRKVYRERRPDDREDRYKSRSSDRRYKSSRCSRTPSPRSPIVGRRRSNSHSPMSSRRRHLGSRDHPKPSRCVGVFGLSVYTTEDEIYHIFSKYGPLERVQVVLDAKTGRSRGFSFVYFEKTDDAKVAKEQCSGMKLSGKNIRVDYSITQRAHTPTPGIYMGKPTYKYSERYDRRRGEREYEYGRPRYSRRSPSPYYSSSSSRRRRYERSRSRSYTPRRY